MKSIITLCAVLLMAANVWAQAPEKMSYQAVIRDASNNLVTSSTVGMRISILQGSPSGTVVYSEMQTPTTNANGLVSIEFGAGTGFNSINWADGPYFLKSETDPTGGMSYSITGASQILSVPYALYAKNTDSWQTNLDTTYTLKNTAHIRPTRGDAVLKIEADIDDSNEEDNPRIEFIQDGRYPVSAIGQNLLENGIENGLYFSNNTSTRGGMFFVTGTNPTGFEGWQGLNDDNIRMTITTNGNVGINTATPQRSLHVKDVMRLEPRSTPPANPSKGDMYFDNNINKLRVFDGTIWQNCW